MGPQPLRCANCWIGRVIVKGRKTLFKVNIFRLVLLKKSLPFTLYSVYLWLLLLWGSDSRRNPVIPQFHLHTTNPHWFNQDLGLSAFNIRSCSDNVKSLSIPGSKVDPGFCESVSLKVIYLKIVFSCGQTHRPGKVINTTIPETGLPPLQAFIIYVYSWMH